MKFSVRVPAKINLHLQVLGLRPDRFHELRTVFQSVDLFDELEGERASTGVLELSIVPADAVKAGEDNLVMRAARALNARAGSESGSECGARLHLRKGIPVGGGLGGGSADAAAALVLLNEMWDMHLPVGELIEIGATLGSDVPFFFFGGLCLGVGRGEEIYPLPDLEQLSVLIVTPDVHISTPEVFGGLERNLTWVKQEARVWAFAVGLRNQLPWEFMVNDLETIVRARWPEIDEVITWLTSLSALRAGLTGSGGSAFALFEDQELAVRAAGLIGDRWKVHTGVTLKRTRAALKVR